jgi:protein phosphatase 4 regulatory subunit 3
LDVLIRTLPRDNLLGSACLDLFELLKKEQARELVKHLVENYREKLQALSFLDTFQELLTRGEQPQGYAGGMDPYFMELEDNMAARKPNGARGLMDEHLTVDIDEEAFWDTCSEDEEEEMTLKASNPAPLLNGSSPATKPLVDYPSDEENDEAGDAEMAAAAAANTEDGKSVEQDENAAPGEKSPVSGPPERLSEKRRREEDEEDELGKLMQNKRRNSSSASLNAAATALRRKASLTGHSATGASKNKITISLSSPAAKAVASSATAGGSEDAA